MGTRNERGRFSLRGAYLILVASCGLAVGPWIPLPHGGGSGLGSVLIVPTSIAGGLLLLRANDAPEAALRLGLLTAAFFAGGWVLALAVRGLVLPTVFSAVVVGLVAVASLLLVVPLDRKSTRLNSSH